MSLFKGADLHSGFAPISPTPWSDPRIQRACGDAIGVHSIQFHPVWGRVANFIYQTKGECFVIDDAVPSFISLTGRVFVSMDQFDNLVRQFSRMVEAAWWSEKEEERRRWLRKAGLDEDLASKPFERLPLDVVFSLYEPIGKHLMKKHKAWRGQ